MKKLLSLTTAFALAVGVSVSAASPFANQAALGEFTPLQKTDGRVKISKNPIKGAAAHKLTKKALSKKGLQDLTGDDEDEVIYEAPEGNVMNYSRSTETSFYYSYFGLGYEQVEGNMTQLVFTEDGSVYFKNPVTEYETESYLKGTLKNGVVTFELPQPIMEYGGEIYYADLQTITVDWDEGTIEDGQCDNQTLQFSYEDGVLTSLTDEDVYLSISSAEGEWAGFGDYGIVLTPFTQEALTDVNLPGTVYNFIYDGGGHQVTIAKDGNDLYIKGLVQDAPDAWVVGTSDGEKYSFEPQYVGIISSSPAYLFAATSEEVTEYYEDYDYTYTYTAYYPAGNLEISYDADKDVYTLAEDKLAVAYSQAEFEEDAEFYYPLASYANGYFKLPGDVENAKPSAPYDLAVSYSDSYGEYWFDFNYTNISEDGQILDKDKLFYNIFIDGEVETFDTELYDVDEEITDIPYGFSTDWSFYLFTDGTTEVAFSQEGFETLGIQMIYRPTDDKEIRSDIVTINVESGEVTTEVVENPYGASVGTISLDETSVKSAAYYDLSGRRVMNPGNGLYIQKVTYNDGSIKVNKIVK